MDGRDTLDCEKVSRIDMRVSIPQPLFHTSDVVRPALFVDGDPVGFEASRKMLGPEWGATNSPSGSPKMAWHYTPGRGLIGATVRLNDKPEAKMVTFR